jgi:hypothetical protein
VIDLLQVGVRMVANADKGQVSKMTFGGVDES